MQNEARWSLNEFLTAVDGLALGYTGNAFLVQVFVEYIEAREGQEKERAIDRAVREGLQRDIAMGFIAQAEGRKRAAAERDELAKLIEAAPTRRNALAI